MANFVRRNSAIRTSLRRGALALILAPALAVLPVAMMTLLAFTIGLEGSSTIRDLHSQITQIGILALVLGGVSCLLGLPTWMFLRLVRRESGLAYLLAGMIEGLLCAFYFGYSGTGGLRFDQSLAFGLLSLTGGAVGWTFWRFAHDRAAERYTRK